MKSKSFEEIQKLYEREQKWINDFVLIDSKVVKHSRKGKAEGGGLGSGRKKTVLGIEAGEKLDDESVRDRRLEEMLRKLLGDFDRQDVFRSLSRLYKDDLRTASPKGTYTSDQLEIIDSCGDSCITDGFWNFYSNAE
ncbi:hypothetical protein Tco_0528406 [Tanacetum coccineum]